MRSNKFWDADDILMSNELVQSIAESDIYGINFQEKTDSIGEFTEENITKEGSKFEIPLWFALILRDGEFSTIKQPKYLTEKYFNLLQADPTFVNIKSKSLYFYEISAKLIPYMDEDGKWPKLLAETIHKRFLYFLRNSANVIYENHSLSKIISQKEKEFYDKMVKINKNVKFFLDNYENNNKNLEELVEAKKMIKKMKKSN